MKFNNLTKAGELRQRASALDRTQFLALRREIVAAVVAGNYQAERLARRFGVGPTTIRTIRSVKTWPAFVEYKSDALARRKRNRPMIASLDQRMKNLERYQTNPMRKIEYVERQGLTTRESSRHAAIVFTWAVIILTLLLWILALGLAMARP